LAPVFQGGTRSQGVHLIVLLANPAPRMLSNSVRMASLYRPVARVQGRCRHWVSNSEADHTACRLTLTDRAATPGGRGSSARRAHTHVNWWHSVTEKLHAAPRLPASCRAHGRREHTVARRPLTSGHCLDDFLLGRARRGWWHRHALRSHIGVNRVRRTHARTRICARCPCASSSQ